MRLDEVTVHLRPRRLAALLDDRPAKSNAGVEALVQRAYE